MRKLLNTLYVTTQGAYLNKEGETVCVNVDREVRLRVPIHTVGAIVCFGNVSCSPFLMGFCGERNVGLCFLSENGHFLARVEGPVSGNVLLRREQYRRADDEKSCVVMARACVIGKLSNARTVLLRAIRDHQGKPGMETVGKVAEYLKHHIEALERQDNLESIRGLEGDAANAYFGVFDSLIIAQKDSFFFHERSRRPPKDNVNALLSFLYTLLVHDVVSALESVGLDPAVGFLHKDRPGRPSLALDIMEELRPLLADRLALSLINLQQITGKGFKTTESGGVMMSDETRKKVIVAYQERKKEEIMHPYIEEKVEIGLLPFVQALLLARHIRGDMDGYPPFFWK
ncbi:MAG: subtype I-C CRISPR-associated endonuclease Cas1 [Candidatus Raymondbacteria bacterium RifOxyC12_full_50_8]|uniref:CRISPR-associated endonuclease Cas1 n=1 Tax=Candidatus Raymondbacteria bacterium RIFOXYD12_FULL_49_13 TaxID=1817890 RepID=A0A1F7F9V8_UNCRA|nr:MAG: subtype I-C CRISPR-associated endonuclease Cas1 [Candidatus Raymondbacteria bacterium RifOxyB12_full_50_8]OGJ93219.1 MAG: subtype I-C CRISPR-associated endonuclease Cas1 [Candidatus Raymondbacteria bacterium RIFOXYA2_FULL_49_16]OGK03302.1 MAG: subtype I-C CRISPR-associated endonuclease Cas1 [Candidatus Raymondbacteria bacterium RIFOXYD12_FULL_49_13]OGK07425.1 MAG: subtype I-C CRISPR-associated endonuclease Cas1 [Candidatus Raymondbacteria bacterium RifOxyC12_full_50_8]OGP44941.1 MAG: su